jgi:hypothetical protein
MKTETIIQHPKHVLLPNSLFIWENKRLDNKRCRCTHLAEEHLDGTDICLAKDGDICICLEFGMFNQSALTVKKREKGLPKQQEEQEWIPVREDILVEDGKIIQPQPDLETLL